MTKRLKVMIDKDFVIYIDEDKFINLNVTDYTIQSEDWTDYLNQIRKETKQ